MSRIARTAPAGIALAIVDAFIDQEWSEAERHQRRIDILAEYERSGTAPAVPGV